MKRRITLKGFEEERGTSLVEYAFVFIFLMVLLLGIVGFGHALYAYHYVDHAAKEAARYAMVRGSTCTTDADGGSCQASNSASGTAGPTTSADILQFVKNIAPGGIDTSQVNITACGTSDTSACTTTTPPPPGVNCASTTNYPGCVVGVRVQYKFNFIVPLMPSGPINMSSTSQMVIAH